MLAKYYALDPLGGFAGWAELGWKGGPEQRQELLQLRTGLGLCHRGCPSSRHRGGEEAAALMEAGSWRLSVFRGLEPGFCVMPRHLVLWSWGGN